MACPSSMASERKPPELTPSTTFDNISLFICGGFADVVESRQTRRIRNPVPERMSTLSPIKSLVSGTRRDSSRIGVGFPVDRGSRFLIDGSGRNGRFQAHETSFCALEIEGLVEGSRLLIVENKTFDRLQPLSAFGRPHGVPEDGVRSRQRGARPRPQHTRILWWGTSHRMLSRFRPASRPAPRSSSRGGSSPRQSGDPDRIPAAGRAQRPAHGRPLRASDRHHRAPGISRSWPQDGRIPAQ